MTDHDLLVRIDERVQKIDKCLTGHIKHHWMISIPVGLALLGLLVKLLS